MTVQVLQDALRFKSYLKVVNIIDDIIHDTNNIDFTITSDWDYRVWDDPIYATAEIDISIVFNRGTLKYSITSPQSDDDKSFYYFK